MAQAPGVNKPAAMLGSKLAKSFGSRQSRSYQSRSTRVIAKATQEAKEAKEAEDMKKVRALFAKSIVTLCWSVHIDFYHPHNFALRFPI
jgi:hypothetical protein